MSDNLYVDGSIVPRVDDSKHHFLQRLTVCCGPSASGKSALTRHILNSLRDVIPIAVVACPTAAMNGDYNGIIPDQCIYDDVSKSLVQKIFQRQQNTVAMYDLVRNVDALKEIFKKVKDPEAKEKIEKLTGIYKKGCRDIEASYSDEDVESAIEELTSKYHKKMVKIMRGSINVNIASLQSMNLTEIQRSILANFNINPSLLFIVDDCMASIKEWKDLEETKKLFFQGRHYFITTFILTQAETLLPPQLRSNAHIMIFTTESIVNTYLNRQSSGITSDERKRISKIAEAIFAPSLEKNKPNYKKLVIFGPIIKTNYKVQYIIGTPKRKRFGSAALWSLCDEVKMDTSNAINNNSFNRMFAIKTKPTLDNLPQ